MAVPTTSDEELKSKLASIGLTAREREAQAHAAALGVPYLNLEGFPISTDALAAVPEEQARGLKAICFLFTDKEVRVGAVDPTLALVKELAYQLGERAKAHTAVYLISEKSLEIALTRYAAIPKIRKIVKGVTISESELKKYAVPVKDFKALQATIEKVALTDLVTILIAAALEARASDIHIEAESSGIVVRFRLDGVLNDIAIIKKELWPQVISRIKLLADLKLNITTAPQDGRFTISLAADKIDVRVSTIPTADGESVVMRLLRGSAVGLQFESLGLRGRPFDILKKDIERPNGMIITTGPTGSGKTTTLYAILTKLNDSETKIITLEDPVEYQLAGINQSQIDASKEYTFAKGLRAILRQDPDVIMVGELRDQETAETAIQAALTGHLVLSTLHTNSAAGAIPRFLSMGVKPFLIAPALLSIIAQRLVRKLCDSCKQPDALSPEIAQRVKNVIGELPAASGEKVNLDNLKFWKGAGCAQCNNLGFKGRIGIYEIMPMSKDIEAVITTPEGMSESRIQDIAVAAGMVTMTQDGLLKALDGITSVDEVFRVAE